MADFSDRERDAFNNPAKALCRDGDLRVLREAAHLLREDDSRSASISIRRASTAFAAAGPIWNGLPATSTNTCMRPGNLRAAPFPRFNGGNNQC
jgi:hypothetical protein